MRNLIYTTSILLIGAAVGLAASQTKIVSPTYPNPSPVLVPQPGGYILERDKDVAKEEPGTHNGGGQTVGYSFFAKAPGLKLVFRKRALKPGSAIGYHLQKEDEIYYVVSGRGVMTIDGKAFDVGPGDAILTRPGSSHGLTQAGAEDLVIMINYQQVPR
jgi:mannose-6-phosphate isomerase-like protein (cupin superfamily)